MIPRFSLTSAATPKLKGGQESIVYRALTPYPHVSSLEELVERCCALEHKQRMRHPPAPSDVWASVLWHLKHLKDAGIVREE
jgi:hypothetical protein